MWTLYNMLNMPDPVIKFKENILKQYVVFLDVTYRKADNLRFPKYSITKLSSRLRIRINYSTKSPSIRLTHSKLFLVVFDVENKILKNLPQSYFRKADKCQMMSKMAADTLIKI